MLRKDYNNGHVYAIVYFLLLNYLMAQNIQMFQILVCIMLNNHNIKRWKSINRINPSNKSENNFTHLIIISSVLLTLISKSNQTQYFYNLVAFSSPNQYYSSIIPENQALTVTLQFSQNFTSTVIQYTELNLSLNVIAQWNQTVTNLPYNFTKFYLVWTKIKVACYPSVLNPNITITLNFYIDNSLFKVNSLNFMNLSQQNQILSGFYTQYDDQIIEIYPQQCISSWQGWKIGIRLANGTRIPETNNQTDSYCTTGNIKSQPSRYYYLGNKSTIYPYLFKFNSTAALPLGYQFFMRVYIRHSKSCIGKMHSPGNSVNETHCSCDMGFVWNTLQNRCERDCSIYSQTNGLKSGSVSQCVCLNEKYWYDFDQACLCASNFYLDSFSTFCKRNCSLYENSNGFLKNGSNTECQCFPSYTWSQILQECVLDCSKILNTNLSNTSLAPVSECLCQNGFVWNGSLKCLKNCLIVQFSTKKLSENPENKSCQCIQEHIWDQQSDNCIKMNAEASFLDQWWGIATVVAAGVALIATSIGIGFLIKKAYMIKRIGRVSPHQLGERTQDGLRVQSMKIIDYYQ